MKELQRHLKKNCDEFNAIDNNNVYSLN